MPRFRMPEWLTIDLMIIVFSIAIIGTGILIAPQLFDGGQDARAITEERDQMRESTRATCTAGRGSRRVPGPATVIYAPPTPGRFRPLGLPMFDSPRIAS
jgi:hypothetical protein